MKIGIQSDQINDQSYSKKWAEFLEKRSVEYKYIDLYNLEDFSEIKKFDGIMWRWGLGYPFRLIGPKLFNILESELGIHVYPNNRMIYTWDDKIKQFYLCRAHGIEMPETRIFWTEKDATEWTIDTDYPKVFKLSIGAGSSQVALISSQQEAIRVIKAMFGGGIKTTTPVDDVRTGKTLKPLLREMKRFLVNKNSVRERKRNYRLEKNYAYFQEFIPGNDHDVRVTIIGDRAFAFRRFNRENDFRASGSGKINFDPHAIDQSYLRKAFEISSALNVDCMAYDFIKKDDTILLLEMCWTFADWAVQKCEGHWDRDLTWHEGHMWPEEAQVEDFILKYEAFSQ